MQNRDEIIKKLNKGGFVATKQDKISNGVKMEGIEVRRNLSDKIGVVFYPQKNADVDEEVENIIKSISNLPECPSEVDEISRIMADWSLAKKHVVLCLQRKSEEEIVKWSYCDLEIISRVALTAGESIGSVKITPDVLKIWGITKDELYEAAYKNTNDNVVVSTMFEYVSSMGMTPDPSMREMIIISNGIMANGASSIVCHNALSKVSETLGETSFVLIPSSVHEFLACKFDPECDYTSMVKEVNSSIVKPEDVLSDHAYYYANGEVRSIA